VPRCVSWVSWRSVIEMSVTVQCEEGNSYLVLSFPMARHSKDAITIRDQEFLIRGAGVGIYKSALEIPRASSICKS